ncbi:MAG: hypothetical protein N4A49_09235 [Marinifilaceae bacterium]|jgi:hypothetical protein|nr:hypothetical protein [Marinifilaceae bacterium]
MQQTNTNKTSAKSKSIINFTISDIEAKEYALKWLCAGEYTAGDILFSEDIDKITALYIPCFLYEGEYTCNLYSKSNKSRLVESISCSFCFPYYAGEKSEIDTAAKKFIASRNIRPNEIKEFNGDYNKNTKTLVLFENKKEVWINEARKELSELVKKNITKQFSYNINPIYEMEIDFKISTISEIYLPYWKIDYFYNTNAYSVIIDGTNKTSVGGTKPEDEASKSKIVKNKRIRKFALYAILTWLIWGIISLCITKLADYSIAFDNLFISPRGGFNFTIRNLLVFSAFAITMGITSRKINKTTDRLAAKRFRNLQTRLDIIKTEHMYQSESNRNV